MWHSNTPSTKLNGLITRRIRCSKKFKLCKYSTAPVNVIIHTHTYIQWYISLAYEIKHSSQRPRLYHYHRHNLSSWLLLLFDFECVGRITFWSSAKYIFVLLFSSFVSIVHSFICCDQNFIFFFSFFIAKIIISS